MGDRFCESFLSNFRKVSGLPLNFVTPAGSGQFVHRYDKLLWKREAALESWALKIERHLGEVRNVWAFVSNHFEGFAPETAQRLAQRLGYELPLPSETEKISSEQERSQLNLFAEGSGDYAPS